MKKQFLALCVATAALFMLFAGSTAVGAKDLSGKLEIFSWWAGDEGPALQALIDLYTKENPNVEVVNATVTGGSSSSSTRSPRSAVSPLTTTWPKTRR